MTPSPQGDLCVAKLFPPRQNTGANGKASGSDPGHASSSSAKVVRCEASRNLKWTITNTGVLTPIYKLALPSPDSGDLPLFQISKPNPNAQFWSMFYFAYAGHNIPPKRIEFGKIQKNPPGPNGGGTRISITGKTAEEKAVWQTLGEGNEDCVEWVVLCAALNLLEYVHSAQTPSPRSIHSALLSRCAPMPTILTVMKLSRLLRRTRRHLAVAQPPSRHLTLGVVPQYHSAILASHLLRALEALVLCVQEVCLYPKDAALLPDRICRALLQERDLVPAPPLRQWAWDLLVGLRDKGTVLQEDFLLPGDVDSRQAPLALVSRGQVCRRMASPLGNSRLRVLALAQVWFQRARRPLVVSETRRYHAHKRFSTCIYSNSVRRLQLSLLFFLFSPRVSWGLFCVHPCAYCFPSPRFAIFSLRLSPLITRNPSFSPYSSDSIRPFLRL